MSYQRSTSLESRFWSHVDRSDGCWLWTGWRNNGYGSFSLNGKMVSAHRLAYTLTYGAIPDGLWVLHHCDVRACCRPTHLYAGTHADNTRDMVERDRQARGERSGRHTRPERTARGANHGTHTEPGRVAKGEKVNTAKLTTDAVVSIRARHAAGSQSASSLAREFGVCSTTIDAIIHRRSWRHV